MNQIQVQEARRAKVREQQTQPPQPSRWELILVAVAKLLQRLMTS